MTIKILVVEDERDILSLLRFTLEQAGFETEGSESGEDALQRLRQNTPGLMLLDLMLPGIGGLELMRTVRADQRWREIPVIILTARGTERDIVIGLEAGADDYIVKPFTPQILVARVKAVLRRRSQTIDGNADRLSFSGLHIDSSQHDAYVGELPIHLTATEFRILHLLARHPGWVFTRSKIVDGVRGDDAAVFDRTVDVHINAIRRKLGSYSSCIQTLRGVGYRFREPS